MTDRGLPIADGSPACPFVAFEDDRDERAPRPDHRHRCFAEAVPAPRALAHQEAYCLSSAFPVCPTFQEWARREAAHARPGQAGSPSAAREVAAVTASEVADPDDANARADAGAGDDDDADDLWSAARDVPLEERPRRNPPRDWAAPPPWASGAGAAAGAAAVGAGAAGLGGRQHDDPGTSLPEESRGLAGSAADRLASGEDPDHAWLEPNPSERGPDSPAAPADPELAGLVGRSAGATGPGRDRAMRHDPGDEDAAPPPSRSTRRPTVSSTRDRNRERDRERQRERAAAERSPHDGPSWERSRRFEAYPSIRARVSAPGIPQLPRVAVLFAALVVAALFLLFLPTLLNIGGKTENPGGGVVGSASPAASASVEPTPVPLPTPVVYTIKAGDTLNKIAKKYNLTVQQIEDANKDTIKDPNRIKVGDKIVIPTPAPAEAPTASSAASASP